MGLRHLKDQLRSESQLLPIKRSPILFGWAFLRRRLSPLDAETKDVEEGLGQTVEKLQGYQNQSDFNRGQQPKMMRLIRLSEKSLEKLVFFF